ncbi:MAG: beta-1,6-N-acetylglucosaminyltransferase [Pseudomonadota bacterium]
MSVGFVMLAHTALHRAAQVVRVLSAEGCPVIVHVDARIRERYEKFQSKIDGLDHVQLAPRQACEWGTWSLVEASRNGAETLLRQNPDLSHVFLISGACLPIKPIPELVAYLEQNRDTDFIESVTVEDVPWTQGGLSDERFTLTFPFAWRRQRKLFDLWVEFQRKVGRKRRMPRGLEPHMGSQWWCLTRATIEKVLQDPRRKEIDDYFRRVWIPDESYFQSMVRLYDTKVESRSLTLSKFDFQGKPHVFYDDHLTLLRRSSAFFARKIWPGATKLYRTFLDGRPVTGGVAQVPSAHIDRTFSQASLRRTRGRPGMVMSGRYPAANADTASTAAPYAVFHGLSDVFFDFPKWVRTNTGSRTHGHLFDPVGVKYFAGQSGYAGALTTSAALRDYDPEQFLRNLIWNTRGEHQSFLFSPRDAQEVWPFLAADRNANICLVTGAWALPLLRSGQSVQDVRAEAALLQQREAEATTILKQRSTRAQVRIWSLAEFLERPLDPLQEIVDSLSGADSHFLSDLPEFKSVDGLPSFLQSLKNAGMNPYTAGEISERITAELLNEDLARFG